MYRLHIIDPSNLTDERRNYLTILQKLKHIRGGDEDSGECCR
jgi:hypothetical protein